MGKFDKRRAKATKASKTLRIKGISVDRDPPSAAAEISIDRRSILARLLPFIVFSACLGGLLFYLFKIGLFGPNTLRRPFDFIGFYVFDHDPNIPMNWDTREGQGNFDNFGEWKFFFQTYLLLPVRLMLAALIGYVVYYILRRIGRWLSPVFENGITHITLFSDEIAISFGRKTTVFDRKQGAEWRGESDHAYREDRRHNRRIPMGQAYLWHADAKKFYLPEIYDIDHEFPQFFKLLEQEEDWVQQQAMINETLAAQRENGSADHSQDREAGDDEYRL